MLVVPFTARIGGGGVLTFQGSASGQPIYWYLEGVDPRGEGYPSLPPVGSLKWEITLTKKDRCATNIYICPTEPTWVEVEGEMQMVYDRVYVKYAE
jgi:hypothetical protein